MPYQTFLRLLRASRESTGISQEKLAIKLGKLQSYVSKIELGERQMNVIELREWCEALGIPIIDFMARLETELKRKKPKM